MNNPSTAIQALVDYDGAVAELADALDLGSSSERSAGSIPVSPIYPDQASLFGDSLESWNSDDDDRALANDL